MNKSLISSVALASALVLAPITVAHAAPVAPVTKVVTFKNCAALNKVYKGGVAKPGVKYNKVSGKNRAFKVKPTISAALYKANQSKDRDRDGIACEKG